jgi:hypothetical protein
VPLPEDFIEQFHPLAAGVVIMGRPLTSLSKKDLAATVVFLLQQMEAKQEALNELCVYQEPRYTSVGVHRGQ